MTYVKIDIVLFFLVIILSFVVEIFNPKTVNIEDGVKVEVNRLPMNKDWPSKEEIKSYITEKSLENGINKGVALNIAFCESNFNRLAKNSNSSASGIFQFISSTWNNYCVGNVFDPYANIDCFVKYYKKYPNWWVCCGH